MSRKDNRKTAKQYQIEDRRRQVAILVTQSYTEVEMGQKLGVDASTISKDIKALKLISQQFIYDIAKSDFTYYYKQCLDIVRLILRKQFEIVDKETITHQDIVRAKILSDMLNTVNTINEYYNAAPSKHISPELQIYEDRKFGLRPGTRIKHIPEQTPEEERAELQEMYEEERREAFEDQELELKDKERELQLKIELRDERRRREAEMRKRLGLTPGADLGRAII